MHVRARSDLHLFPYTFIVFPLVAFGFHRKSNIFKDPACARARVGSDLHLFPYTFIASPFVSFGFHWKSYIFTDPARARVWAPTLTLVSILHTFSLRFL